MSGGGDSDIKVWDIESGYVTNTLSGHKQEVVRAVKICTQTMLESCCAQLCIQCASDIIASASADSSLRLWNYFGKFCPINVVLNHQCLLGLCLHVLDGHIGVVRCLKLKGNILVSGGDQKRIIIWDVQVSHARFVAGVISVLSQSGKQLHTVHRQQTLVHRMCITDTQVITASPDSPGSISIVNYW